MTDVLDSVLRRLLIDRFDEIGDRGTDGATYINRDGCWRDPQILQRLPHALSAPFKDADPTVVLGPQSSGYLLGPLVAQTMGIGFVGAITAGDRVLIVDDWADTGSQLLAVRRLVRRAEAQIAGTSVIADALVDRRVRRELQLVSLVHARELWK